LYSNPNTTLIQSEYNKYCILNLMLLQQTQTLQINCSALHLSRKFAKCAITQICSKEQWWNSQEPSSWWQKTATWMLGQLHSLHPISYILRFRNVIDMGRASHILHQRCIHNPIMKSELLVRLHLIFVFSVDGAKFSWIMAWRYTSCNGLR